MSVVCVHIVCLFYIHYTFRLSFCVYSLTTHCVCMLALGSLLHLIYGLMILYVHLIDVLITWVSLITSGTKLVHMQHRLMCNSVVQGPYVSL